MCFSSKLIVLRRSFTMLTYISAPPSVGKTLTVEVLSKYFQMPRYAVMSLSIDNLVLSQYCRSPLASSAKTLKNLNNDSILF
jgi:hypothetical protein